MNIAAECLASCLVFRRHWVQISARRPAVLTEVFRVFSQSFHANSWIVPSVRPDIYFFHTVLNLLFIYNSILRRFIYAEILTALINEPQINKYKGNKYLHRGLHVNCFLPKFYMDFPSPPCILYATSISSSVT
jgi:hypothetical protein